MKYVVCHALEGSIYAFNPKKMISDIKDYTSRASDMERVVSSMIPMAHNALNGRHYRGPMWVGGHDNDALNSLSCGWGRCVKLTFTVTFQIPAKLLCLPLHWQWALAI